MPYIRVTQCTFNPAQAEEYARLQRDAKVAMRRLPGVLHYHSGIDHEAGRAIAITTFDTREHAGFDRQGLGDAYRRLQALGTQWSLPVIYEVVDYAAPAL